MRTTDLFGQTRRDSPADAEVKSHQLLIRAGFIRQLGSGIFSYLHLAKRTIAKIETLIREEMDSIGGQEISMPVVHPADIWKETGRWFQVGSEMGRFKDKNNHDMVLAMTHEEVVADLVRKEVHSYKQLPRLLYHIQTKWRDDPRPRSGLIRVREFTMKDSYSLDVDQNGLINQYNAHLNAYRRIFSRCSLPVEVIFSDTGIMGGSDAHEFMYLTPIGEDTILICDKCGYKANRQIAKFRKSAQKEEPLLEMHKVHTPGTHSIQALSDFLDIPKNKTAKAVFFMAEIPDSDEYHEEFIFTLVRGDMELNETKLSHALRARRIRPATDDEIRTAGAVPGYASPVGLKSVKVVIDDIITESSNLVSGANEVDYHYINVNYPRDFSASIITDIASAGEDCICDECGSKLRSSRGVEVGNIFQLGTRYSESMNCTFLDRDGDSKPVYMGSYGIGIGRLLACVVEEHHDVDGIIWPAEIAPYQIHIILLRGKGDNRSEKNAENLYKKLTNQGFEVLYDDSNDSPGVKFNNADLIGCPIRITVSDRAFAQGGVEIKFRNQKDRIIIPLEGIGKQLRQDIQSLIETDYLTYKT